MDEKVISFKSRRPLAETIAEEEKAIETEEAARDALSGEFLKAQLELLDQVRSQVVAGNLQNLVIVSRNPHTGLFMHDIVLEPSFDTTGLAFGFTGILEALKMEMATISQMAPTLTADGTVITPYEDEEDEEE